MDIERVNIVFNYDMPEDSDTYLHRVARAGRFGTKGLAITFVSDENDAKILNSVQDRFDVNITELPDEIDLSSYSKFFKSLIFIYYLLNIFFYSWRTIRSERNSNHEEKNKIGLNNLVIKYSTLAFKNLSKSGFCHYFHLNKKNLS